jgi:hypothetical protein
MLFSGFFLGQLLSMPTVEWVPAERPTPPLFWVIKMPVRCRLQFNPIPLGLAPPLPLFPYTKGLLLLFFLRRPFVTVIYSPLLFPPSRGARFLPPTLPSQQLR